MKKLSAVDYAFMIGGPLVFLLLAVILIRSLLGGTGPENPVTMLREGAVKTGMSEMQVENIVGPPKSTTENPNGGTTFRYQHGAWDSDRRTFLEEDAYVDFDASDQVSGISFESRTPPLPK
ncbi:MAG: hypothetical protein P4L46_07885 [Fimbriimonas sp.]|nr:hypothetical protein [Fimbriimonas sp.]